MSGRDRLRTDVGTVVLHVVLLACFVVALGTGLRIASDDPDAEWLAILDPILPVEHLWLRHLAAGVTMVGALAGYAVYLVRARLGGRLRFDATRAKAIWRGSQVGVSALNVAVVWVLLTGLVLEAVTGAAIFWGAGQAIIALHHVLSWLCLACVVAHVGLHVTYGGVRYALKIFRPSRLRIPPPPPDLAELLAEQLRQRSALPAHDGAALTDKATLQAHPIATAIGAALVVAGIACGSEVATRPVLRIVAIAKSEAPTVDGDVSDPVWSKAHPVSIMTTQGGDFGGTHQSRVEIRALHDGEFAYLVFSWDDPTRSLKHNPLIKTRSGWRVASSSADFNNEEVYHEDKFAVLLSPSVFPMIGAAIHLSKQPLNDRPAGGTGRGLHYTLDGSLLDVWLWRASHEGPSGHIDNCHFGAPDEAAAEVSDRHYAGGFALDPGPIHHETNFAGLGSPEGLHPRRLPRDLIAMSRDMGRISDATNESESENARWWMSVKESIPFNPHDDASIPVGSLVPGVLVLENRETTSAEIVGFGRWAGGRWTLEVMRRLKTGSAYDVDLSTGVLLWVAAFDHAQKRHSRHLRPFRLELE